MTKIKVPEAAYCDESLYQYIIAQLADDERAALTRPNRWVECTLTNNDTDLTAAYAVQYYMPDDGSNAAFWYHVVRVSGIGQDLEVDFMVNSQSRAAYGIGYLVEG